MKAPLYFALGPHCWGRARTISEAIRQACVHVPENKPARFVVYATSDRKAYVDRVTLRLQSAEAEVVGTYDQRARKIRGRKP